MKIVFRVDASVAIGTGHVMRCLALAETLASNGAEVSFISRNHQGNLNSYIIAKNFKTFELPISLHQQSFDEINHYSNWLGSAWQHDADETTAILKQISADYIIVDHYALDSRWEKMIQKYCKNIVVIDDLANRDHDCHILIDQTIGRVKKDYTNLVPESCSLLLGVDYALLRREFAIWRDYSLSRRHSPALKNILVSLGGVDKNNITVEIMEALDKLNLPIDMLTIVMGKHAPHTSAVANLSKKMSFKTTILIGVENMAELMAKSDLVIGAAGSSSWERSCLGVPSIALVIADNQQNLGEQLSINNMAMVLSPPINHNMGKIFAELNNDKLKELSSYPSKIVDGRGCERVVNKLFELR